MRRRTVLAGTGGLAVSLAAGLPPARAVATGRRHALSLLGEPALPADFTHFPYVNPDAPKGGEVVQHAIGSYDSFNPFIVRGVPGAGIGLVWMPLMASSQDEASTEYCELAESVEVAPDRTWVAFDLRPEAAWHDGQPVTADDVVWTFKEFVFNPQIQAEASRSVLNVITDVTKVADRVVEFTFKEPMFSNFESALRFYILPKHFYEKFTPSQINSATGLVVGSGPFKLARLDPENQWTPGEDIVLVRNENFSGPKPPLERMRFKAINDDLARLTAFRNSCRSPRSRAGTTPTTRSSGSTCGRATRSSRGSAGRATASPRPSPTCGSARP